MTIKKIFFILFILSGFTALAVATPPGPIVNLTVSTGPAVGSVTLRWTNPSPGPINRYLIRYRQNGPIVSESEFTSAFVYSQTPSDLTPNAAQELTINGLTVGVLYGFAVKTEGATSIEVSGLSNPATAYATTPCTAGASDGLGAFSVAPANIPAGELTRTTMTFTVDSAGIGPGGLIAFQVPNFWNYPFTNMPPSSYGAIGITSQPADTVGLQLETSSQFILVRVTTGSLVGSDIVKIFYNASTCSNENLGAFRAYSQAGACGERRELAGSPQNMAIVSGGPQFVQTFSPQYVPVSSAVAVNLFVQAQCGRPTVFQNATTFYMETRSYMTASGFGADPLAFVSSSPAGPFSSHLAAVTANVGERAATFYYLINSASNRPNNFVEFRYASFQNPTFDNYGSMNIFPIDGSFTNVSVDTGTFLTGITSVVITPNNDGDADRAFINFTAPAGVNWTVKIIKQGTSIPIRQIPGYGIMNARVTWDGYKDFGPGIADPGFYNVVIEMEGGVIRNTDLTIQLNAVGVTGTVTVQGSTAPIPNAYVNLYGPNGGGGAQSDANGVFAVYGLRSGEYTLDVGAYGFSNKRQQLTLSSTTYSAKVELVRGATLRVSATRDAAAYLPEVFGGIRAHTLHWEKQAYGSIHFGSGKNASDAGDFFSVVASTYTDIFVEPGASYIIDFDIPNYGLNTSSTVVLAPGEVRHLAVHFGRRGNIEGLVTLPSSLGATHSGVNVSIEAGPDADMNGQYDNDDFRNRFWSGMWIQPGNQTGYYRIFGVPDGTYLVKARLQGFITATNYAVIATSQDDTDVDFSTFSTGGVVTINLTVLGDSTGVTDRGNCQAGEFTLWANGFSPSDYSGGSASTCVVKNATSTTASVQLTGLGNGNYEIFSFLQGFETFPPGPKVASVATSPLNLTLKRLEGRITGTITLPGTSDFDKVEITLRHFGGGMQGVLPQPDPITTSTYSINGLGTGFYLLRAYYPGNGLLLERSVQVVNNAAQPANVPLSFTAPTYSISGTVSTNAGSLYNSISYIVTGSTPMTFIDSAKNFVSTAIVANIIFAKRVSEFDDQQNNTTTAANLSVTTPTIDTRNVFYGVYNSSGEYAIPNLTPGTYRLYNNGEMDGDWSNGPEVSQTNRIVVLISTNATGENFTLSDGYDVGGTLRIDSGVSDSGRIIRIVLLNAQRQTVVSQSVNLVGATASFNLERIPPGDYVLSTQDFQYPRKYSAKDVRVQVVSADITNKEIVLLQSAKIKGKLRIKTSGELITTNNYATLLPGGFNIFANANPWFPGGSGSTNFPIVGVDDTFGIDLNPGTYDVILRTENFGGESAAAQGQKQFVPIRLSGIQVEAGQTKDIGIIELSEGIQIKGAVTDSSGNPLSNIVVKAYATSRRNRERLEAITNHEGKYTLFGVDPEGDRYYTIIAAPRPDNHDSRFGFGFQGSLYGEVRRRGVDTRKIASGDITSVDFSLSLALGSVSGTVVSPDHQQIYLPFDDVRKPGAEIIMNRQGNVPEDNPLGDIDGIANADGTFQIKGLVAGTYDMWVLAEGYGSGFKRNIVVQNADLPLGTITLSTGTKLSGTLTKVDGSLLNENDINAVIGVRNGFEEVIIGAFTVDAGGSITNYSISGFQPNKAYSVLLLTEDDEITLLGSGIIVNTATELNFVVSNKKPEIFVQAFKGADGSYSLRFDLTKALRNSTIDLDGLNGPDDSDPTGIIRVPTPSNLTFPSEWISADRKKILATYTPSAGETSVVVTASCTFVSIDPATGLNFQRTKAFTIPLGIGKSVSQRVTNANGGAISLEGDTSEVQMPSGLFGDDASLEVEVQVSAADDVEELSTQSLRAHGRGAMSNFSARGANAYPSGMGRAMSKLKALEVDPFSSFYDIFLPNTVSHFFPHGKEARMCLSYDAGVSNTDAYSMNVYYFNEQTNEYILEDTNKAVDTDNKRICVSLTHASVFTILQSSVNIISGGSYSGALTMMNFPNPFNLKSKTVTLQDPGSATASRTIEGTMLKISAPTDVGGALEIEIFGVSGERVRTLTGTLTAGTHTYVEWDGRNDEGQKVASGAYIARMTVGGGNEKFLKLAVIK